MSRSSSSPDVLQPPGDADYIVSSPFKPFSGRQSFMSPANFRPLQTPRKRQRVSASLSPDKSAHSIQFDDVLLPASPTMRLNGQKRFPSPEKDQSDGNTSPWRVRVTLEATQDENNQGSPTRKRRGSPTKTTKVPLRDADEPNQTPRRRGRPRKSGGQATPNTGSPGNTPGPGGTGQKRKRGRPRKSTPVPEISQDPDVHQDTQMHGQIPSVEPAQDWSPLNIAADGDSDFGVPENPPEDPFFDHAMGDIGEGPDGGGMEPGEGAGDRSPRVTFNTPDVGAIDRDYMDGDENLHATPSKILSPSRPSRVPTPENTLHAGHTPGPRTYPTPTSSQTDEEPQSHEPASDDGFYHDDPTDDHREFDSIVESEEFSMVSLDTLPSAKQHGVGNEKLTKGPLKPFLEREANGITDRKRRTLANSDSEHVPPARQSPERPSPNQQKSPGYPDLSTALGHTFDPPDLETSAPSTTVTRSPFTLARVVRVGIVFGDVLRHQVAESPAQEISDFDIEDSRKRLGVIFGDFHPEIERVLQAGLGVGQKLAKRFTRIEPERARQAAEAEAARERSEARTPEQEQGREDETARERSDARTPEQEQGREDDVDSEMKRRFAEWQREREAISREIEMANSSQVIVIDSDSPSAGNGDEEDEHLDEDELEPEQGQEQEQDHELEYEDELVPEQGQEQEQDRESEYDAEPDLQPPSEDDYEDIWQAEARDGDVSNRSSQNRPPENEPQPSHHTTSSSSASGDANFSPHWAKDSDMTKYLGQSRVKQLREQEVSLSPLFQAEYTPRRYQYYYGKSTPSSSGQGGSRFPAREPIPQSNRREDPYESHDFHPDQGEDEQGEDGHGEDGQEGSGPVDEQSIREEQSTHDNEETTTPNPSRQTNPDIQGSSWFQRLTSFTPGWLKAPTEKPEVGDQSESLDEIAEEDLVDEDNQDTPVPVRVQAPEPEPEPEPASSSSSSPSPSPSPSSSSSSSLSSPSEPTPQPATNPIQTPNPTIPTQTHTDPFTNTHYTLLRHLYHDSQRHPQNYPYREIPTRRSIMGDWIFTSDRHHGIQITELQFAVVDRFRRVIGGRDYLDGDRYGTYKGLVDGGWSDLELHRRLVSVIIGEGIRGRRRREGGR